jgi:glycerol uptake facilitator-like aquaporin
MITPNESTNCAHQRSSPKQLIWLYVSVQTGGTLLSNTLDQHVKHALWTRVSSHLGILANQGSNSQTLIQNLVDTVCTSLLIFLVSMLTWPTPPPRQVHYHDRHRSVRIPNEIRSLSFYATTCIGLGERSWLSKPATNRKKTLRASPHHQIFACSDS